MCLRQVRRQANGATAMTDRGGRVTALQRYGTEQMEGLSMVGLRGRNGAASGLGFPEPAGLDMNERSSQDVVR